MQTELDSYMYVCYAATGRASCKKCGGKIEQGELKLSLMCFGKVFRGMMRDDVIEWEDGDVWTRGDGLDAV